MTTDTSAHLDPHRRPRERDRQRGSAAHLVRVRAFWPARFRDGCVSSLCLLDEATRDLIRPWPCALETPNGGCGV